MMNEVDRLLNKAHILLNKLTLEERLKKAASEETYELMAEIDNHKQKERNGR